MKIFANALILAALFLGVSCSSNESLPEGAQVTFKVNGNCGMCKKTMETPLTPEAGVLYRNWDVESKKMTIVYDSTQTNPQEIQAKIAATGYDTELVKGDDEAYEQLHECCKYDREEK